MNIIRLVFHSDSCKGHDIKIVIHGLVYNEWLSTFTNFVILFLPEENIASESGRCVINGDTGGKMTRPLSSRQRK